MKDTRPRAAAIFKLFDPDAHGIVSVCDLIKHKGYQLIRNIIQ